MDRHATCYCSHLYFSDRAIPFEIMREAEWKPKSKKFIHLRKNYTCMANYHPGFWVFLFFFFDIFCNIPNISAHIIKFRYIYICGGDGVKVKNWVHTPAEKLYMHGKLSSRILVFSIFLDIFLKHSWYFPSHHQFPICIWDESFPMKKYPFGFAKN